MTEVATGQRWDLVGRLVELAARDDRGGLAALRRGLGKAPGAAPEMYPYVEPGIPRDAPASVVEASYVVATLFGLHPLHRAAADGRRRAERGLGFTLRAIRSNDGEEDAGVARRFAATLDAPRDALGVHLRHLVTLLDARSEHTPIDYRQLLSDLLGWDHPDRYVQRGWAAGFWGREPTASDVGPTSTDTVATNDEEGQE